MVVGSRESERRSATAGSALRGYAEHRAAQTGPGKNACENERFKRERDCECVWHADTNIGRAPVGRAALYFGTSRSQRLMGIRYYR